MRLIYKRCTTSRATVLFVLDASLLTLVPLSFNLGVLEQDGRSRSQDWCTAELLCFVFFLWKAVPFLETNPFFLCSLASCGEMVGKQEGAGHGAHHLQPRPEHDQGRHTGEGSAHRLQPELL